MTPDRYWLSPWERNEGGRGFVRFWSDGEIACWARDFGRQGELPMWYAEGRLGGVVSGGGWHEAPTVLAAKRRATASLNRYIAKQRARRRT